MHASVGVVHLRVREATGWTVAEEIAARVVGAASAAMLLWHVGKRKSIAAEAAPAKAPTTAPTVASIAKFRNKDQPILDWSVEERMVHRHSIRAARSPAAAALMECVR